ECSGGEWAPNFADNLKWFVKTLMIGSTRGWAKGVILWNLALDENHGPHTGGCGDCRGVVTINSASGAITRNVEYYALAHASRFARAGARRIASTSGVAGLESVAFRNADDGSKALIVVNTDPQDRTFPVRWANQALRYTLPAGAVVSFVWSSQRGAGAPFLAPHACRPARRRPHPRCRSPQSVARRSGRLGCAPGTLRARTR